jgi:hypothetical protein
LVSLIRALTLFVYECCDPFPLLPAPIETRA